MFGAALVIGAGANIRVNDMVMTYRHEHPMARQVAREAVLATTGLQVLTGLGAIALGIIALAGIVPLTLRKGRRATHRASLTLNGWPGFSFCVSPDGRKPNQHDPMARYSDAIVTLK